LAFVGLPGLFLPEVDQVHISVSFTWDIPLAERLAEAWAKVAPVGIGGPALGEAGGDFLPGLYLRPGYVITSRGCPNRCWFCSVPAREGPVRELPITEGNNILDDNLLACSDEHIRTVFAMLKKQKHGRVMFTGGLEAARLKPWHISKIVNLHPKQIFFAFDTPDDYKPLVMAASLFKACGINPRSHVLRSYVLIGYPGDTINEAEKRLRKVLALGIIPMAMLWRDDTGRRDPAWVRFAWPWVRPAAMKFPPPEAAEL
jgi:hypothetical protein